MNTPGDLRQKNCGQKNFPVRNLSDGPERALIAVFLLLLATVPVVQCVVEWRRGETPGVLRVFRERPTRESLAAFERSLEDASVTANTLRPWMQAAQFFALHDGGGKVLVGRSGQLFYATGVDTLTQRGASGVRDALAAVTAFRDALAARGIRLIVVPVPNKESVYPQWLTAAASPPERIINPEMRAFFAGCAAAGVEVVDLFARYREISRTPYYLAQDTHWSPHGLAVAARAVAERIGTRGDTLFETRPVSLEIHGDLVRMMRSPVIEAHLAPEHIEAVQVLNATAATAPVLVLGDSFSRIFQTDEPHDAGFVAHLAHALGQPVASLVNDGGAATLVRQELFRRPELLAGKKIVVWEFTERDLRLATEGWQVVPLPP
jgi:hypothetical protein